MTLQERDPALAGQVNPWCAAHAVDVFHIRPCGPLTNDDAVQQWQLEARVHAVVGDLLSDSDRWRPFVDQVAPGLADDPHWPALVRTFSRACATGYDLEAQLPALIAERSLPGTHARRAPDYRLAGAWPEAFKPWRPTHHDPPAAMPIHPPPAPDYPSAFDTPSISRGGPCR